MVRAAGHYSRPCTESPSFAVVSAVYGVGLCLGDMRSLRCGDALAGACPEEVRAAVRVSEQMCDAVPLGAPCAAIDYDLFLAVWSAEDGSGVVTACNSQRVCGQVCGDSAAALAACMLPGWQRAAGDALPWRSRDFKTALFLSLARRTGDAQTRGQHAQKYGLLRSGNE